VENRRSDLDGQDLASPLGPASGPRGRGRETPPRAVSAAGPLAVGLRAQEEEAEQAVG